MSVRERLRATNRFDEYDQENGTTRFTLRGHRWASIYALSDGRRFHVRVGAVRNERFPNSAELGDYLQRERRAMRHGPGNAAEAFELDGAQLNDVLAIIGWEGL